jgi:glucose/arabinose dehydrogenase
MREADTSTADAILTIPQPSATNHKGGTVVFDNSGRIADQPWVMAAARPPTAQDNNTLLGKILRIDPINRCFPTDAARDYAIPTANPFASGGGLPEIYASGLRNPFRISVDPVTGDLFIGDVGDRAPSRKSTDIAANTTTGPILAGTRREGSQAYNWRRDSPAFTACP